MDEISELVDFVVYEDASVTFPQCLVVRSNIVYIMNSPLGLLGPCIKCEGEWEMLHFFIICHEQIYWIQVFFFLVLICYVFLEYFVITVAVLNHYNSLVYTLFSVLWKKKLLINIFKIFYAFGTVGLIHSMWKLNCTFIISPHE